VGRLREFEPEERETTLEEKQQKLEREQLARSYKKQFSGPDGLLLLHDLLARCHIFHSTFNQNGKLQDFSEGQRAIGLYIIGQLEIADLEKLKNITQEER
jgi:hypothetical protein